MVCVAVLCLEAEFSCALTSEPRDDDELRGEMESNLKQFTEKMSSSRGRGQERCNALINLSLSKLEPPQVCQTPLLSKTVDLERFN